jgi:hypothetical protein
MKKEIQLDEILHLQEEYITLLGREIRDMHMYAVRGGWSSGREAMVSEIKDKIDKLKK